MPPSWRARTGCSSIRLDVSAALRMSASPMVRTLSAWAANSGLLTAVALSAVMKPSTLASSSGSASAETWGAIRGACVVVTAAGASGAVRVSVASGGVNGATAAAPSSDGPAAVVMRISRRRRWLLRAAWPESGMPPGRLPQMSVGMTFVPFFIRSR